MSVPPKKLSILIVSSTTFCTSVLPNLMRDVERQDHHRKSADDLSEIREVVKIHLSQLVVGQGRPLPNQKTATDAVALQLTCAFELEFVLGSIEVAFRFCDKSVVVDVPEFITADSNVIARAARSGVRSG